MKMTPFAKKVYRIVAGIPVGQTRTYKWVAKKAGRPRAYRAVGQLMKHNPFPIIIPCHRVIASSGSLGGYIWGVKTKKALLDLERQIEKFML